MDTYEAEAYLRGLERRKRAGWEQARYIVFSYLHLWVKELSIDDMPTFSWEKEKDDPKEEEKALAALYARKGEFEEYLNNKINGGHNN